MCSLERSLKFQSGHISFFPHGSDPSITEVVSRDFNRERTIGSTSRGSWIWFKSAEMDVVIASTIWIQCRGRSRVQVPQYDMLLHLPLAWASRGIHVLRLSR